MKKNTLLSAATLVGNLFSIGLVLSFVGLTGAFVHYLVKPSAYQGVEVRTASREFIYKEKTDGKMAGASTSVVNIGGFFNMNKGAAKAGATVPMEEVHLATLVYFYAQVAAKLILLFLMTAQILKVITSVRMLITFRDDNVRSLRKIGFMCLGLSAVQWFYFFLAGEHSVIRFRVELMPLVFMLAAFILAEIFREGNKLYEQERLTI